MIFDDVWRCLVIFGTYLVIFGDIWRYMVIYAGSDLKNIILKIINKLAERYIVPKEWREMIIKSVSKGKGDLRSMNSRRGLSVSSFIYSLPTS